MAPIVRPQLRSLRIQHQRTNPTHPRSWIFVGLHPRHRAESQFRSAGDWRNR